MKIVKVGDRIRFRSPTRFSNAVAVRKVKSVDMFGRAEVRYAGCSNFIVRNEEILEIVS